MHTFWVMLCILPVFFNTGGSSENTTSSEELDGKHESLHHCPLTELGPEDYELLPDGSVRLDNVTLDEPSYILRNGTLSFCSSETTPDTTPDRLKGKNESLLGCATMTVPPGIYVLLPNKSAYFENFQNLMLDEPFYIMDNGTLSMCVSDLPNPTKKDEGGVDWISYLTLTGLVVSMVCLLLHLVVFCLVADMRNLPGWNLAALCACLFVSYLLIVLIGVDQVSENRAACVSIGSLAHFFMLSSFIWMSIMSCDVFGSLLRATGRFRSSSTHFSTRKFGLYCLCAFGTALLFSTVAALADRLDFAPDSLRPHFHVRCWFNEKLSLLAFFAGPVLVLTGINFLLFGASSYVIHANKRKSDQDAQQPALKKRYFMYFRLSVIMGSTWIVFMVANAVNEDWLWYIFVLLNTLQGLFIFLAFTCCEKAKKYFREKIGGSRRSSQQTTTTPTSDNCTDKELDKVAVKETTIQL